MPQLFVPKPFRLNIGLGQAEPKQFMPGVNTFTDEEADHWYVKENTLPLDDDSIRHLNIDDVTGRHAVQALTALGLTPDNVVGYVTDLRAKSDKYDLDAKRFADQLADMASHADDMEAAVQEISDLRGQIIGLTNLEIESARALDPDAKAPTPGDNDTLDAVVMQAAEGLPKAQDKLDAMRGPDDAPKPDDAVVEAPVDDTVTADTTDAPKRGPGRPKVNP